jgi:CheY-like chemotaxis protein
MSHEIRTPMNGIIGMTDLALDSASETERKESMKVVKSSAESLLGILNDILDFSKIEAGKLVIEDVGFDLRSTVADALKTLRLRAHEKGLELICDCAEEVPVRVIGDPVRLRQVLLNLVGNALKFTHSGQVVVSLTAPPLPARSQPPADAGEAGAHADRVVPVRVSVRDSGIGIAPDKLATIFESFSQADTSTTREYGGTGLGLTITQRLVGLMGGEVGVHSTLGQGSDFFFTLPLRVDPAPKAYIEPEQLVGKCALVVDDNAVNREIFARQLARWGMSALLASSGLEAQQRLLQGPLPDVILLDVHMPAMDGFMLAEWIKQQPGLASVPILVLSSGPIGGDSERCRTLGLNGYRSKPITDTDLRAALVRILGTERVPSFSDGLTRPAPLMALADMPEAPGRAFGTPSGSANPDVPHTLQVLLVEDNPVNQQLARRLLEKWGHRVTLAQNGQEAVDALASGQGFDMVLMDMQMPVMGGLDATRRIRQMEADRGMPRVRIVAMTANAMQGDREACIAAGMDDYLSKPIHAPALEALLQAGG